ncbi:MAG: TonB-dependent receptor [Phycisphaerae bacterium]|nr:TonB-dependent receptor [Gemmatimonadaceae bacterium]
MKRTSFVLADAALLVGCLLVASDGGAQSSALLPQVLPAGFHSIDSTRIPRGAMSTPVTLNLTAQPLGTVLAELARLATISFAFERTQSGMEQPVTLHVQQQPVTTALSRVLRGTAFSALLGPGDQVVIVRRPPTVPDGPGKPTEQERLRLSGYVRSQASHEVLRHALITADGDVVRRESNEEGFYVLMLEPGLHRLRIRSLGYVLKDTTITLTNHTQLDFSLATRQVQLATVSVQASTTERADLDPRLPDMSVVRLDLKALKLVPPVLGEPDPIRSLALLPGVSLSSDASTAFSVRGGQTDQNLILLDEATIYNPSHILGFLSTFNTDAVDDVTLYKGAIPSKFGGRLSSVVDIRQREGNANRFQGTASIGLLASRLALEGPLPGKRGSYMVAGRRSYADLFLGLSSDSVVRESEAYFYDLNAKVNFRLGTTGALMASGYLGNDRFSSALDFGADWGNKSATLRWNQAFGGRLFSKVTTAWADYSYRLNFSIETSDSLRWTAGIRSIDFKVDEQWHLARGGVLEFGGQLTAQEFRPGSITPSGASSQIQARTIETRRGLTSALYVGHEIELGSRVSARYGLRFAQFNRRGQATIYRYADNAPVMYNSLLDRYEPASPVDSTKYANGTTVASFNGWEPRVSARFSLTDMSSIKASYARTQQFLQMVTNSNSTTPLDVWEPAGPHIRPQVGDQVAVGYSATLGAYEVSAEVYTRTSRDVVDYIDGADLLLSTRVETALVQGKGRAKGFELLTRRTSGRLTGWVSYTLSKSEQRFPAPISSGVSAGRGINDGRWYSSPLDKLHNLSVVGMYELNPRWVIGSTFALASGLPTTLPESRYQVDGLLLAEFAPRNSARLPLYHRLDLSATWKRRRTELQFGVLNIYNRFNAQALHVRQRVGNPLVTEAVRTSVFGIVPSINYVRHF